jgi:uncharacterized protein (DUF433 family)
MYGREELCLYVAFHAGPTAGEHAPLWLHTALNPIGHEPWQSDYSFSDLISLLVVAELVKLGLRQYRIRESEAYLRQLTGLDRPFVTEDLATDRVTVFIPSVEPGQLESTNRGGGQQVQVEALRPYLRYVKYYEGKAVSWTPSKRVRIDPQIQFGEPVIDGTRITTEVAADIAATLGPSAAAERLDVDLADVKRAVAFEQKLETLLA